MCGGVGGESRVCACIIVSLCIDTGKKWLDQSTKKKNNL